MYLIEYLFVKRNANVHLIYNYQNNFIKRSVKLNHQNVGGMQSDTKQKRDEALPLGESVTPKAQPIASGVG